MSDYLFKGIPISEITYTTGGVNTTLENSYISFPPTVTASYSQSKPLDFGYDFLSSGTQTLVSEVCTAMYNDYTTSETIIPPTGVKQFRYLILGGGGSGGGFGGDAKSTTGFSSQITSTGDGGNGGPGGYSTYTVGSIPYSSGTISIIIGTGGSRGNNGSSNSTTGGTALDQPKSTSGGKGNSNPGKESYITFNSVKYTSVGGTRGLNGNGATAKADLTTANSTPGKRDNVDANYPGYTTSNSIQPDWPPLGGTYGQGGSGGVNANRTAAKAGGNGICRIIWLYD